MNNLGRNIAVWIIIGLVLVALFNLFQQPGTRSSQTGIAYSDFLSEVRNGSVKEVVIQGSNQGGANLTGTYTDGRTFTSIAPNDPSMVEKLTQRGVTIRVQPAEDGTPSLF